MKHRIATRLTTAGVTKSVAVLTPLAIIGAVTISFLTERDAKDATPSTTTTTTTHVVDGNDDGEHGSDTTVDSDSNVGSTDTRPATRPRGRPGRTTTTIDSDLAGPTTTVDQQSGAPVPCVLDQGLTPCGFTVSGNPSGTFSPGAMPRHIDLQITNHNAFAITLLEVTITVAHTTSKVGCDGTDNLIVTRPFTGTADIPANTSVHLSDLWPIVTFAQWPTLQMPNLPLNQDACKGATFLINYTGTATS